MSSDPSHSEQLKAAIEYARKLRGSADIPLQAMDQRISVHQEAVNDMMALWGQRQRLQNDLQAEIEERRNQLQSTLYEMESSGNIHARLNLEAQISGLSRECRQHKLELFRDLCMLTRDLHREEQRLLSLWPLSALRNRNS